MTKTNIIFPIVVSISMLASCGEPVPGEPPLDAPPGEPPPDAAPPSPCGNDRLDPGEECDDGAETERCDIDCTAPACGDGVLNQRADELCDDGNTTSADGCSAICLSELSITGIDWYELETADYAIWYFDGTLWRMMQLDVGNDRGSLGRNSHGLLYRRERWGLIPGRAGVPAPSRSAALGEPP